jgi:hypothetical protein
MSDKEQPKTSWSGVKTALADFDRDALMALIRDLYGLSATNKHFVHARLGIGQDPLAEYKRIVSDCMYPDVYRNRPVQISRAKKAVSEYRRAASDIRGEIDLMIPFVECGNQFTLDYGDIDENFYDSLLSMYSGAVKAVVELPQSEQESFRERLRQLTESSNKIGWGYHDGLCEEYYRAFPEAED